MAVATRANRLLGAPGVFAAPASPVREITGVRRDVAAFFGVAPRGQARVPLGPPEADEDLLQWMATQRIHRSVPVRVTSWNEYLHHFGGYEGPGRLPYAVSAFFAGGGEEAWVTRIVHDYADAGDDMAGRAGGVLAGMTTSAGPITFFARSEGRWGDGVRATLTFDRRPLRSIERTANEIIVDEREWVPNGSLLRIAVGGDVFKFVYVDLSELQPDPASPRRRRHLRLVDNVAFLPGAEQDISVVSASLVVVDSDRSIDRRERIDNLGLHPMHPRWVPRAVIEDSEMLWPDASWVSDPFDVTAFAPLLPDLAVEGTTPEGSVEHMVGGLDRWSAIEPTDFFDHDWLPGNEAPGDGIQAIAEHDDIGLVLVPDLYDPAPLDEPDDVNDPPTLCGPDFDIHHPTPTLPPDDPVIPGLLGLRLDPGVPGDLAEIVERQLDLQRWAHQRRDLTVLLDAPLGLTARHVLDWRTNFDSPYLAAYHPWLDVSVADDRRDALARINPSAFAAPIIAERELRLGVQFGPANEIATGPVRVAATVNTDEHDELHRNGINVFAPQRDGIMLTGARTLSRRQPLRQLSVARFMAVLRLSIEREMQWVVFEPNNRALWARVQSIIDRFLTRLYRASAFRGARPSEAFFVRCDETTMTANDIDNGRLIALVGVAPAEPIEYIVIRVALAAAEGIRVEVTT